MAGSWGLMSLNILKNVSLAPYTSWHIGGPAEFFCLPIDLAQMKEALDYARENKLKITVLGGGSNVLISDAGVKGLTICLRRLNKINSEIKENKFHIECLAGTAKSELLKLFLRHHLAPALFLAGLPGDVGGGIVMNAGVAEMFKPREFMELVDSVEVMTETGEIKVLEKAELKISYRHTTGWQPHVLVRAKISWPFEQDPHILTKVREANRLRLSKQPLDLPSCGSVFQNPEGHKAAQLIDRCGLKGFQIGGAQVSLKHANFIVNQGGATASDTLNVIQHVQKTVKENLNVDLLTEVKRIGEWV